MTTSCGNNDKNSNNQKAIEATVKPTETPRPEETQSPESTGDPITTEPEESVTDTVISNSGTADTDTATDTDTPKNDIEQGN